MHYRPKGKLAAPDFVFRAGVLGAKLGFVVAGLYSLVIAGAFTIWFIVATADEWMSPSTSPTQIGFMEPFVMMPFASFLMACLLGVLPGTLIGIVTAIFTAVPLFLLRQRLSLRGATQLGIGIALLITAIVHFIAASSLVNAAVGSSRPSLGGYLLFLGVPSIFYIATNGYGSRRLFKRHLESRQEAA